MITRVDEREERELETDLSVDTSAVPGSHRIAAGKILMRRGKWANRSRCVGGIL